jgi:hypothetical protein
MSADKENNLDWAKIAALTTLQETQAEQIDRLQAIADTLGETAQLLNETLKDARADRLTDIINARLDAFIQAQQQEVRAA